MIVYLILAKLWIPFVPISTKYCFLTACHQKPGLATRSADPDAPHHDDILPRDVLQVRLPLPPAEEGHHASQESKAENQNEEGR